MEACEAGTGSAPLKRCSKRKNVLTVVRPDGWQANRVLQTCLSVCLSVCLTAATVKGVCLTAATYLTLSRLLLRCILLTC